MPIPPKQGTIDKLEQVLAYIEAEPQRLYMGWWGVSSSNIAHFLARYLGTKMAPPCGTVSCLAGAALIVSKQFHPSFGIGEFGDKVYHFPSDTPVLAAQWLGLSPTEAKTLFYTLNWPIDFRHDLKLTVPGTPEYVGVTKQRIRHFEATGE